MGQFSWMFADTDNQEALNEGNPAYVALPNGSYIFEPEYDGYGNFGGKDIYDLVADWNRKYLAEHPDFGITQHWGIKDDKFTKIPVNRHRWYQAYADLSLTPEQVAEKAGCGEYRLIGIDIACYDDQNEALPYPIKICREKPEPGDYERLPASESDPNQGWGSDEEEEEEYGADEYDGEW